jgi:hypothetical protein
VRVAPLSNLAIWYDWTPARPKARTHHRKVMNPTLEAEVRPRFGVLPSFSHLASSEPQITINLWGFAKFAYLDNPLLPLFKGRLFVYLSRFCEVRYWTARHLGFLVGLGHSSSDANCSPQIVQAAPPLLRRALARENEMLPLFSARAQLNRPLASFPVPDSIAEEALWLAPRMSFHSRATPPEPTKHCGLRSGSQS